HGEAAEKLKLGGVGSLVKLGRFGVVNGAGSWSKMRDNSGQQWNWGYQYNTAGFSISTQQTRRTRGFGNLALYDQPVRYDQYQEPIITLSRSSAQYALTLNMGAAGSVGAAWIDVQSFNRDHTRLLNLSWNKTLWNSSLYLAASHDYEGRDWTFALSLQIPLGEQSSVALSAETTPESGSTQRVNFNQAMPSDGGFSWNLAYARQSRDDNYQQATLGWRNNHIETQGGIYGQTKNLTRWAEATGSVVTMDGELFAANQINDAFAVVSTDGQPGVTVNFENQPVGETDEEGYLLVSGVTSYYPATYSIDALNLPADTRIRDTERRIALRRNSGYLVTFPMEQERVASVILHDENDQPLPVSSQVFRDDRPTAVVGYDGIAWLEDIGGVNPLRVTKPDGSTCRVTLTVSSSRSHRLETYGPLICREGTP
ncbi:fimbria/pilus outer membrane usher protein, partial [Cronobacter sakazakii]